MELRVTWIGHSTFLLVADEVAVLTDPWFGETYLMRRLRPPGMAPGDITRCDFILVSHGHRDHFDESAFGIADRLGAPVVGPPSVARRVEGRGLRAVVALPGEPVVVVGVEVRPIKAFHPAPGGREAVGYVWHQGGWKIYFAGDTLLTPDLVADLRALSPDLMMVPIGAFRLFGLQFVMGTREAVDLARRVRPRAVIPMHYDTLRGTKGNPELLRDLSREGIAVHLLTPGRPFTLASSGPC